ncbi:uncharacterized protein [Haliotis asinina]|uniref:uncharacterized protein n=1 Tax=Haliotis asinina TaxID=109174 RepID=UPI003531F2E1
MDVPSHLLQPLSIDTNIIYDLDTTMFPGLDHPQHMHQPALLVASPEARESWLSALKHDDISDDPFTDDLFDLIEDCFTETFQPTDNSDSDSTMIQSVFDDIIDSTSSDQSEDDSSLSVVTCFPTGSCTSSLFSPPGQQVHPSSLCWNSSCASSTTNLKRKRESEDLDLTKRSKLDDLISSWIYADKGTYDICVRGF